MEFAKPPYFILSSSLLDSSAPVNSPPAGEIE